LIASTRLPLECSSLSSIPDTGSKKRDKPYSGHSKRAATGNGTAGPGKLLNPFVSVEACALCCWQDQQKAV
jgi:hypothetical protein